MKCSYSENDIALYVEGDVEPAQIRAIAGHLAKCPACSDLAASLRDSQALLKSLRREAISPAALSSVRSRVLAEIDGISFRWAWGRWVYAAASAVFVAVIGVGIALQMQKPELPVQQIVQKDTAIVVEEGPRERADLSPTPVVSAENSKPSALPAEHPHRVRKPKSRAVEPFADDSAPVKTLVVKLLTEDPDVVIYWLVDQKDGGTL